MSPPLIFQEPSPKSRLILKVLRKSAPNIMLCFSAGNMSTFKILQEPSIEIGMCE